RNLFLADCRCLSTCRPMGDRKPLTRGRAARGIRRLHERIEWFAWYGVQMLVFHQPRRQLAVLTLENGPLVRTPGSPRRSRRPARSPDRPSNTVRPLAFAERTSHRMAGGRLAER